LWLCENHWKSTLFVANLAQKTLVSVNYAGFTSSVSKVCDYIVPPPQDAMMTIVHETKWPGHTNFLLLVLAISITELPRALATQYKLKISKNTLNGNGQSVHDKIKYEIALY